MQKVYSVGTDQPVLNFLVKQKRLDEDQYTLVYVFFYAESDVQVSFALSLTIFLKKSHFH